MFARDLYRHGLLGRFIGIPHVVARLHGKRLCAIVASRNAAEQRQHFEPSIALLFD
jgi:S-adenosylmethionine-diacylglycerol 3-amino-3-carboxypropyl transferase